LFALSTIARVKILVACTLVSHVVIAVSAPFMIPGVLKLIFHPFIDTTCSGANRLTAIAQHKKYILKENQYHITDRVSRVTISSSAWSPTPDDRNELSNSPTPCQWLGFLVNVNSLAAPARIGSNCD